MKAGIFLVGTELLNGATIDTNSIYIAEELNKYGIEIEFKMTVRDVMDEIVKALKYAKKNVDLVILTGGLGPTDDDITKEAMAKFLKKKLVVDEKEKKEPTVTELKILDTYWSDHCRHSTFNTILENIEVEDEANRLGLELARKR